jgi:hypothetical protein
MHLIDYGLMRDGVLYHGTVSDLDGSPKATWTYAEGGENVTRDRPVDAATFGTLWNATADSDILRRNVVRSPGQPIGPVGCHVVGVVFERDGQRRRLMSQVPAAATDPEFVQWRQALNVPQGSA